MRNLTWALAIAASLGVNTNAQLTKTIDFSETGGAVTLSYNDAEVTLQPIAEDDDLIDVHAAIGISDFQSIIVSEGGGTSPYFKRWIGIGKLSSSEPTTSIILQGYSGGAHCCATLRVVTPVGGQLKILEFEPIDGEGGSQFPEDIDGDGNVDFVRQDDRFRYQFSSGAGSQSPPLIFNIYKGNLVDVTSEPGFVPLWTEYASRMRAMCADRSDPDRNGACAAYVAASARLGKFATAMKDTEALVTSTEGLQLPTGCRLPEVEGVCPAGMEREFYTFGDALRWFLKKNGYIS